MSSLLRSSSCASAALKRQIFRHIRKCPPRTAEIQNVSGLHDCRAQCQITSSVKGCPVAVIPRRSYATEPPDAFKDKTDSARASKDGTEAPDVPSAGKEEASQTATQWTAAGVRDRTAVGVFTPASAALFVATGLGLYFYFRYEKQKMLEKREKEREEESRSMGRAMVGGSFSLVTHRGHPFSELDLLGKWSLIYFGFTHCPDICPMELDKIGTVVTELEKDHGEIFLPLFITVDPARDPPAQLAKYLAGFHPRVIGLTGAFDTIKATCKAYRVYFSTPPSVVGKEQEKDYLVDHSIYIYLMDPEGQFVEAFGQNSTPQEVVERVKKEVKEWEERKGKTA